MKNFESLMNTNSTLKALELFTIPLKNKAKFPNAKNWQNRTWTEFTAYEKEGMTGRAINTGLANIVVIDLDIDKETGEPVGKQAWEETCKQLQLDPYDTFTVHSPSGGLHLYFSYEHSVEPIGQSSRLGKGVGIDIRGKGGLIVAPGSENEKGVYTILEDNPIQPLPKRLSAILTGVVKAPLVIKQEQEKKAQQDKKSESLNDIIRREKKGANHVNNDNIDFNTGSNELEWWQKVSLEKKQKDLLDVKEGERDNTLTAYAYHAGGDGINPEKVVEALLPAALKIFSKQHDPQSPELEAKILRCATNGLEEEHVPGEIPEWAQKAIEKEEKASLEHETKTLTLARGFIEEIKEKYRYIEESRKWVRFENTSGLWKDDSTRDAFAQAMNIDTLLIDWLDKKEDELAEHFDKVPVLTEPRTWRGVLDMVEPHLRYDSSTFDNTPTLLNASGTVVDMKADDYKSTMRPAEATDFFTRGTAVPYDEGTDTSLFDEYINMFSDENKKYLQMILGQALTGFQPTDPQIFFLYGDGSNGKSTLQHIMKRVLGDYIVYPNTNLLLNQKSQDHQKMILQGARCAYFEELPARDYLDVKSIKDFASGGEITASRKYENEITFKSVATVFVNTNHLPRVRETEEGAWRRLVVIDFPYSFKNNPDPANPYEKKANPQLAPEHIDMLPDDHSLFKAALLWMLEGANKWFKTGMASPEMPEDYAKASKKWQGVNDRIGDFWDNYLEQGNENDIVLVKDLYDAYKLHSKENGQEPGNKQLFVEDLQRHANMRNKHEIKKGRIAKFKQSVWFNPELSWKDDYKPYQPSANNARIEYIQGLRFIGTGTPDDIADIVEEDIDDLVFDIPGNEDPFLNS